ncbi:MAG: GGDEF domain-containing protein [Phycisphaerales bacterium]|jgi:two-component system, cell cycle response regulator|nr:GGDEF domain-containing protein [Phycisphaerales bacterium]MBT7171540.1 GGDEF domain-containing protein [Phycisphaerales bacterium]
MNQRWIDIATELAQSASSPDALAKAIARLAPPEELAPLVEALAEQAHRAEELECLASTDDLTGLANRRVFAPRVDSMLARAEAKPEEFRATLLLFDIDDFKQYNDAHGHGVGDTILHSIAKLLQATTREHDLLGRIGGDEFAVLFWDTRPRTADSAPLEAIDVIAERFRAAVESASLPALGSSGEGHLTISGGLAVYPADGATAEDLLAAADAALAEAKTCGKNNILLISNPREAS